MGGCSPNPAERVVALPRWLVLNGLLDPQLYIGPESYKTALPFLLLEVVVQLHACHQMIPSNCCRLVEDADLRAAQELFGSSGDMQQQKLKTLREHENYGRVTRL